MLTESFQGAIAVKGFLLIFIVAFILLKINSPDWMPKMIGFSVFILLIYFIGILNKG